MQRRVNVFVPFACPRCDTEMVVTLEELHEEATIKCNNCGKRTRLAPEKILPKPKLHEDRPITFHLNLAQFESWEIAEILGLFSDIYRSLGGDGLIMQDVTLWTGAMEPQEA